MSKLERIGLIMPLVSRYHTLQAFTQSLYAALQRIPGLEVFLLTPDEHGLNTVNRQLQGRSLQALVVFNSYFVEPPFSDQLAIPTLYWLVDGPYHFSQAISHYGILGCVDRHHSQLLHRLGYRRIVDLPHAVDVSLFCDEQKRRYDCAMFASAIDYRVFPMKWRNEFPKPLWSALEDAAALFLEEEEEEICRCLERALLDYLTIPLEEALQRLPLYRLLRELDLYVKGITRIRMIERLERPIDLFGGGESWKELLGERCSHVTIHGELSYQESLHSMRQTKVILNSSEHLRDGGHERLFAGLACGAAVATRFTPFLAETFKSEDGLLLYGKGGEQQLAALIEKAIEDDQWRYNCVQRGKDRVRQHHLWDHRAADLVTALERWLPFLPAPDPLEGEVLLYR